MKDTINYFIKVDKLTNYDQTELIDLYNNIAKDWCFYGLPSKNTLWILPIPFEKFCETSLSNLISLDLVESVAFVLTKPKGRITPHTDTRSESFLIPILGDFKSSDLMFYDTYIDKKIISLNKKDSNIKYSNEIYVVGEPALKLSYDYPVIINSRIIHSVNNRSSTERINFNITLNRELSYNDIMDLYQAGKLVINT